MGEPNEPSCGDYKASGMEERFRHETGPAKVWRQAMDEIGAKDGRSSEAIENV